MRSIVDGLRGLGHGRRQAFLDAPRCAPGAGKRYTLHVPGGCRIDKKESDKVRKHRDLKKECARASNGYRSAGQCNEAF